MAKNKKTESKKKSTESKDKSKKVTTPKAKPKKTTTRAKPKSKAKAKPKATVKKKTASKAKATAKPKSSAKTKASTKSKATTSSKPKKTTSNKKAGPKSKKETKSTSRAKPVVVDIIEDDELEDEAFFSDETLQSDEIDLETAQDFFLDLEEGDVPRELSGDEPIDAIEEKSQKAWTSGDETDRQKQFYKKLATEIDKKDSAKESSIVPKTKSAKTRKSIRLYRSLAWKFLILVSFLAAVVFYFSFTKLTIYITPEIESTSDTLHLKVAKESQTEARPGDGRTQVTGSVNEVEVGVEKTYLATGEEYTGEAIIGKVKIINNYSRAQPLVATTRLLSPDGKQFRIKNGVNVPAGSSVEVEIYADKISREMAIAPTRFTIPGLWVGLQDKIYAESSQAFEHSQKMKRYVKASDLELARSEAYDLILEEAKSIKALRSQDKTIYHIIEPIDLDLKAKTGDKVDSFDLKVKANVAVISLSEEEVQNLAATKLKVLVADDKELIDFNSDSLSYVLENYDSEQSVAAIKVTFSGRMVLKKDAKIINKEKLVSLNSEQIRTYLKDYPEIGQYDLKFYPSFINRAPQLVDRIEIKIKK